MSQNLTESPVCNSNANFCGTECMSACVCIDCVWQCLRVDNDHSELLGLALDAEHGLIYYTDILQGVIAEMTTKGANRREIIRDRNTNPHAIVVDPDSR